MKNLWKYTQIDPAKVMVREVEFNTGKGGDPVVIIHMTDPHFNMFTERDLENPALASTHEFRKWQANGQGVANCEKCFEYAEAINADQVVITGDVLDFLAEGTIGLMKEHIWDKHPKALVSLGNHEMSRKVQGKVEDDTTPESRKQILKNAWAHDITYESRIIKDKVIAVVLDNSSESDFGHKGFFTEQIEPLKRDIELARENGMKLLLFFHDPLYTAKHDVGYTPVSFCGDKSLPFVNFATQIKLWDNEGTLAVYDLITHNADVIAGCFCGHFHNDFYTEIRAWTPDGEETLIPQYVLIGTPYNNGHVLKITVK